MTSSFPVSIPDPIPFNQLLSLTGRCAIVTGGTRGIGGAIATRLAEAGAAVVVTDIRQESLDQKVAEITASGGKALGVHADASNIEDAQRVIDTAVERFGTVDILVNNAAVFPPSLTIEMTEEIWDKTVDTDMKGPFFLAKAAAKQMIKAGRGGKIINLLSTEIVRPTGLLPAYSAAKAGLMGATQSMALELAEYGILVNGVLPGSTLTAERLATFAGKGESVYGAASSDATKTAEKSAVLNNPNAGFLEQLMARMPLGRTGFPDDLAKAVLFMASDLANYISGTSLRVDGAQSLR